MTDDAARQAMEDAVRRLENRPGPPGSPEQCRAAAEVLRRHRMEPGLVTDWRVQFLRFSDRHEQRRVSEVLGLSEVNILPRRRGGASHRVLQHDLLPGRQFLSLDQLLAALDARAQDT